MTAFFPDGAVIYTNPFARYDALAAASPMDNRPQQVDYLLTILYNLMLLALAIGAVGLWIKFLKQR